MSNFPVVLIEQARSCAWATTIARAQEMSPVNPGDSSMAAAVDVLRRRGMSVRDSKPAALTRDTLDDIDVYVIPHLAAPGVEYVTRDLPPTYSVDELDAIEGFVRDGGGLVILAECDTATSGNNLADVAARFGVTIQSLVVQESPGERRVRGNATWVLADLDNDQGILAAVESACFYRTGVVEIAEGTDATTLARTSGSAWPAGAALAVSVRAGRGRVVIFADSDLFGDDSIDDFDHRQLWTNVVTWAGGGATRHETHTGGVASAAARPEWLSLKASVEQLRALQADDGSIGDAASQPQAGSLCDGIDTAISSLTPLFPHDADYLDAVRKDIKRWTAGGFGKPDFGESLAAFRPDLQRVDGVEHLVIFPMYTQNGHAGRVFEAVLLRVMWPQWLADVESSYDNRQFLPVLFEDFTSGYDTNSAVLFPETVSVADKPEFHWGAIFCDREAARFRRVVGAASEILSLQLPPFGERLVGSQTLAQSTFAMWDLLHDRTHSRGELPFDPFMIRQRMPYWLYSLEELRCDLSTFRIASELERQGHPYGQPVQLAILFDRLFRFPITGDRVRNYDGLGGQLLFGYLHRNGSLHWRDNRLSFDWKEVGPQVISLGTQIEELYRSGIDRSKVGQWLQTYRFVSSYVEPAAGSAWAKGELPLGGPPRELVDHVAPDEFPLNVFYEALKRKMQPVIDSTRGITSEAA
ncbi:hypothetical protein GOEFS_110_00290 [Gordonia effusa NBRC 100432]|uniref:DUF4350 domain-containing protein n=1 Tax=Gordonia effusa NBRC 100432 TaxID=1077974 RepID=H0R5F0_9ACTN|nr:DUF6421 family protein [Gordonia effusa]GAB20301.1 hypothetical protein GOEFS_110_00290 [Gordonia effusa NBRC 100432]